MEKRKIYGLVLIALGVLILLIGLTYFSIKNTEEKNKQNYQQEKPTDIVELPVVQLTPEQEKEGVKAVYNDNGILLIDK